MQKINKMIGISIYPDKAGYEATKHYVETAAKYGFKRIFTNLIGIKNDADGQAKIKKLSEVYHFARKLGFEVIVDVNPNFYKEFNLKRTELDYFLRLGASGVRLDEDFNGDVEAILSNNKLGMKIELNASSTSATLEATLKKGGNPSQLIACHNFYPMRYTGLKRDRFIALSSIYKSWGVKVAAFITLPKAQATIGPWDINDAMPTLEEHRDLPISAQIIDLLQTELVDDIIISAQGATPQQLQEVAATFQNCLVETLQSHVTLKIDVLKSVSEIERDIIFRNHGQRHFNRPDFTSYFVRSTMPRIYYKNDAIPPHNAGKHLEVGDVVVLNEKLGRYKGELHIILRPIDDSVLHERNLVGKIRKKDLYKISVINARSFEFSEGEE